MIGAETVRNCLMVIDWSRQQSLARLGRNREGRAMTGEKKSEVSQPVTSGSGSPSPGSAHESARFIASVSLSLGALMLSLFGIIERMVSFEKLGVVNEFALLALLPGIATLAFLACARAISWMISYMTFAQWHGVVPQHRWEQTRRLLEESNQFQFRITLMAGAYLLFTLVITALAATSAGLAFGLSAPELSVSALPFALLGGGITAVLVLYEMLTRDGVAKTTATGVFVTLLILVLVLDVVM
jgi:hypothetical protein